MRTAQDRSEFCGARSSWSCKEKNARWGIQNCQGRFAEPWKGRGRKRGSMLKLGWLPGKSITTHCLESGESLLWSSLTGTYTTFNYTSPFRQHPKESNNVGSQDPFHPLTNIPVFVRESRKCIIFIENYWTLNRLWAWPKETCISPLLGTKYSPTPQRYSCELGTLTGLMDWASCVRLSNFQGREGSRSPVEV